MTRRRPRRRLANHTASDGPAARSHRRVWATASLLASLLAALIIPRASARAQQLLAAGAEEDNAQLAYWIPPIRRPDDEFTNGTRISLSFAGSRLWSAIAGPHAAPCGVTSRSATYGAIWTDNAAAGRCFSTDFTLAQENVHAGRLAQQLQPSARAAPVCGATSALRDVQFLHPSRKHRVLGRGGRRGTAVAGGRSVQEEWHRIIHYYTPLGWSHQIPTAPEFDVGASESRVVTQASIGGIPVLSVMPRVSVSAGNVLTGGTAGAEARIGYGAGAPWTGGAGSRVPKFQIYALAAARVDYVWTELVLDRSSTDPAYSVSKIPWVGQYEFGGGVRLFFLEAEYRAVTRTREYQTGPSIQPYAAINIGVRRGW